MKPATWVDDRWAAHLFGAFNALEAYLRLISTKTIHAKWYAKMDAPNRVETGPACQRYAMCVPVVLGFSNASCNDKG